MFVHHFGPFDIRWVVALLFVRYETIPEWPHVLAIERRGGTHTGRFRRRRILYGKRCDVIKFSFSVKFYYALIRAGIVFSSRFKFSFVEMFGSCNFIHSDGFPMSSSVVSSSSLFSSSSSSSCNSHSDIVFWKIVGTRISYKYTLIHQFIRFDRKENMVVSLWAHYSSFISLDWFFHSFSISETRKTRLCVVRSGKTNRNQFFLVVFSKLSSPFTLTTIDERWADGCCCWCGRCLHTRQTQSINVD